MKFIFLIISFMITGCFANIEDLRDVGKLPSFTESSIPIYTENSNLKWQENNKDFVTLVNNNSLWRPGSREFFRDRRARSVGDILKVVINIKDNANLDNQTARNRTLNDTLTSPKVYGYEKFAKGIFPKGFDLSNLLNITGAGTNNGQGKIKRKEDIQTEIAAMVIKILPSGSLVIQGNQEVRVNYELREVTVSGIIRPEDIGADNSIGLDQIAEARISYGGRGSLSRMQRARYGNELIEVLSPF